MIAVYMSCSSKCWQIDKSTLVKHWLRNLCSAVWPLFLVKFNLLIDEVRMGQII